MLSGLSQDDADNIRENALWNENFFSEPRVLSRDGLHRFSVRIHPYQDEPTHIHHRGHSMKTAKRSLVTTLVLLTSLVLSESDRTWAQSSNAASAAVDTFIVVVPLRPEAEIKKDIESLNAVRSQAKLRLARANETVSTLATQIATREKDLDALEGALDTLDSDTKAQEIVDLKKKIAVLEKFRDLLELRKELREGEADAAKAVIAYTEAQEEMYSGEIALAKKRADRETLLKKPGSSADVASLTATIKDMESDVLDQWEHALDKHKDSLSEEQDFVDLLKKLAKAQSAFHEQ
jgi:hypothetical protein